MDERKQSYFYNLSEISSAVKVASAPLDIIRSILGRMTVTMQAKGSSLMLLSPDRKVLMHTASYGMSDWYIKKGPISADRSLGEALEGKPVAVVDVENDDRIQYHEEAKQEGIASVLSVPVLLRGEVIGEIRVYTAEKRDFDDVDIGFVSEVAKLGVIAPEIAKLYDSVQKDYDKMEQDIDKWRAAFEHE
jgi:signal transduction protein with GAF and PtsI domain